MGVILLLVVLAFAGLTQAAATGRPSAPSVTCADQSLAGFPHAFTSTRNLVAGPLVLIGARRYTDPQSARRFGGAKYPALVRAGHRVTVEVTTPGATLDYSSQRPRRKLQFVACQADDAGSQADGDPVVFWSGFVRTTAPRCVRLRIWADGDAKPRHRRIELGRRCQ